MRRPSDSGERKVRQVRRSDETANGTLGRSCTWKPPARLDELGRAHAALARLIQPATPRGILLLNRGRQHGRPWLGPVRLIRQMLLVVIVRLVAFVVLALSPDINHSSGDIFNDSFAPDSCSPVFYLMAGGRPGAAFYALFTAYQYIAAGTYDTTYESSYGI